MLLADTPGHAKLRRHAFTQLRSNSLTGIIFVVDAANLSAERRDDEAISGLADAASYLHDILLELQILATRSKSGKIRRVPVLVAANKMDLFTALPVTLVRSSLEAEIGRQRETRAKGIAQDGQDEESDVLGGDLNDKFKFDAMDEWGVEVEVIGGNVEGTDDKETEKWWDWVAQQL